MRSMRVLAHNTMRHEDGKPATELVLHTFEGRDAEGRMLNLETYRIWFSAESLRQFSEMLAEVATAMDAMPKFDSADANND